MDIKTVISSLLEKDNVAEISRASGESEENTRSLLTSALPLLLGAQQPQQQQSAGLGGALLGNLLGGNQQQVQPLQAAQPQQNRPQNQRKQSQQEDSIARLIQADTLQMVERYGITYRKVKGHARFLHNNTYLICDSALWNVNTKVIDAMGHVLLKQEKTVLKSDNLTYYVDRDLAEFRGNLVELVDAEKREYVLKNALQMVYNDYDYIFIDCPPSLGIVMTSALVATDSVLIPIQAEFLAMDGLALITHSIDLIRGGVNPMLELNGIIFTMVNATTRLTQDVMSEVRGHFGDKVYETTIPRNVRVSEAPSMGVPVVFLDPRSRGAESYKAFAWEFLAKNPTRGFAAVSAAPASAPAAEPQSAAGAPREA